MAYRPYRSSVAEYPPATVATTATLQGETGPSVATVASVARGPVDTGRGERLSAEDRQYLFEERAAILEYDAGLSREDAERLAVMQESLAIH